MSDKARAELVAQRREAPPAVVMHVQTVIDEIVTEDQSEETRLLREIIVSLAQLNANIAKMEKSLADMLGQGVKVRWHK